MDKLVEFGYHVSKDYDKLLNYISNGISDIFGFIGEINGLRQHVYIHLDKPICIVLFADAFQVSKEDFVEWCEEHDLTFIDPEPTDTNAIYYSDGSVVDCDCDIINTDGIKAFQGTFHDIIVSSFIHLERGSIYVCHKLSDGQIFWVTANQCHGIKWKRNTMTNVVKVCDKSNENKEN